MARYPGQRDHLERARARLDHMQTRTIGDRDPFDGQGLEDLDRVRAPSSRRNVVVAGQDDDRQAGAADAVDALGELALVGRVWDAAFVNIAGDQDDVHALGQAIIDRLVQPRQVVVQPGVQAGGRIDPAVVFRADVQVGQVEHSDHIGYRL
jgi:hypothetical protein